MSNIVFAVIITICLMGLLAIFCFCFGVRDGIALGKEYQSIKDKEKLLELKWKVGLDNEIINRWTVLHNSGSDIPFDAFNGIAKYFFELSRTAFNEDK